MVSLVGSEVEAQRNALVWGLAASLRFHLVERGRRAADRLAELRDGSIGSLALGDPLGPNLSGFRGSEARHQQDLLKRVGIEIKTHLEFTRRWTLRLETTN